MLLSKSTNEVWHGILFEVCVKRDRMCFIDDVVVFFIFAFMSESESRDIVGWYGTVFYLKNPTPIKRPRSHTNGGGEFEVTATSAPHQTAVYKTDR